MKRLLIALCLASVLGCSGPENAEESDTAPRPAPLALDRSGGDAGAVNAIPEYNIGDVETSLYLTLQMEQASPSDSVLYEEIETRKYELASALVRMSEPYPESLTLGATAETRRGFRSGDSVVGRIRVHVNSGEEPIATEVVAWDGNVPGRAARTFSVDIIPHLDLNETAAVVHAEMDIFWLSEQPFNLLNPKEAIADLEPGAVKVSNPVRIEIL